MTEKQIEKKLVKDATNKLKKINKKLSKVDSAKKKENDKVKDLNIKTKQVFTKEEREKILHEGTDPVLISLLAAKEQLETAIKARVDEYCGQFVKHI